MCRFRCKGCTVTVGQKYPITELQPELCPDCNKFMEMTCNRPKQENEFDMLAMAAKRAAGTGDAKDLRNYMSLRRERKA